jgi:hypothetical protein
MQKNTKILLGLGLIGIAYYLWQKSSKIKGLPSVIKPNEGLNGKCSIYAGSQLAAMRFVSAEAYDEAWKREYDKCMAGKMKNQENPLLIKIREKRANQLSNDWCEIMSKAYSQGRELNQDEEMRANQIGKQVEELGYTGLGFSIVSGVPNCNQLITIEESNQYPRF